MDNDNSKSNKNQPNAEVDGEISRLPLSYWMRKSHESHKEIQKELDTVVRKGKGR